MYVYEDWCTNSRSIGDHCSRDLESMSVVCRPFYLPRELTVVTIMANIALSHLQANLQKLQRTYPDGAHIVAGDFNHACLKSVLPNYVQHVNCATRTENTLDCVSTNIKNAYRAVPLPHLGLSDHLSLLMIPAYTPLRRKTQPTKRTIKTWPDDALTMLQDCFEQTLWDTFKQEDLSAYTETVLSYIKTCADNVAVEKHLQQFPNQKPWMTGEVKALLRNRNTAFRSGDQDLYSSARADL